jgi:hypothetical protein
MDPQFFNQIKKLEKMKNNHCCPVKTKNREEKKPPCLNRTFEVTTQKSNDEQKYPF